MRKEQHAHLQRQANTHESLQVFAFTAPYSQRIEKNKESKVPCPWYRPENGQKFIEAHGLAVSAVGAANTHLRSRNATALLKNAALCA